MTQPSLPLWFDWSRRLRPIPKRSWHSRTFTGRIKSKLIYNLTVWWIRSFERNKSFANKDSGVYRAVASFWPTLSLIRFGGHLSKGEYDGHHGRQQGAADAAELHGTPTRPARCAWSSMRARRVAAAARDLGLTESSLRNWVEQARADRTKGKTGLTTEERTELAALRKDNRELRMERDILKKAAAFFARNQA